MLISDEDYLYRGMAQRHSGKWQYNDTQYNNTQINNTQYNDAEYHDPQYN